MSKITIHNYEAFLLDSMEGNLSTEMAAELVLFFENHPDLEEDFNDFELLELTPPKSILINKEELKKGIIISENCEEYIIAEIEKENSVAESTELTAFISKNKKHQKEFVFYQKTKLVAPIVIFENKEQLKRKERKIIPIYWWMSSAAAILLALFLLRGIFDNKIPETKKLVHQNETNVILPQKKEIKIEKEVEPKTILATQVKKKKATVKVKKELIIEEEQPLIATEEFQQKEDSVIVPQVKEEEPILYANNVKITFEEEPVLEDKNPTVKPQKKKKKSLLKKLFNSQVRDKVMHKEVNQQGEIVAYALVVGKVNLYRKEVK